MGPTRVVFYSGGIASWATARRVIERHGTAGLTLLFTDTMSEDEDLYRFLDETSERLGVPVTRIADGRDIWEVFRDTRMLGNTRADPCSRILKRELARKWIAEHAPDAVLYFGIDWTEVHRLERIRWAWAPWTVEAPMTEPPYRLRAEMIAELEGDGIAAPRLYRLGFEHNNCGGGCVKAGVSHFTNLLRVWPERYAEWEANEQSIRDHLGRDVAILRDRTDGDTRPLTLAALRERVEAGASLPMFDIGGCACFEDPEQGL